MERSQAGFSTLEIVLIVVAVLLLGVIGSAVHQAKIAKQKAATSNGTTASQPAGNPSLVKKGYFAVVLTDLSTVGRLSAAINQTCAANFPPPQPCQSNVQAYQQALVGTKADLSQVIAPASFEQADTSLRSALDTDMQAVNNALDALQYNRLGEWLVALGQHNKAWQQLLTAKDQALSVSG